MPDLLDSPRRRRRALGPIAAGLVAIFCATLWVGGMGLLTSIVVVGSWWAYKFWPRPPAPETPGARVFLQELEMRSASEVAEVAAAQPQASDQASDVLRDLRL
jgi:hypothetical protein